MPVVSMISAQHVNVCTIAFSLRKRLHEAFWRHGRQCDSMAKQVDQKANMLATGRFATSSACQRQRR
jgi:hypothetical protein